MTDFTLKDVLEAEREAAERLTQAEAEAQRIRSEGQAQAERMEREATERIETQRRKRAEESKRDVEEARRAAEAETGALMSAWDKKYRERREAIISRIIDRLTGEARG